MYIVRLKGDSRRWLVKEARSLRAAINAINSARASGSVGWTDIQVTYIPGAPIEQCEREMIAHVSQINSDGTERQPYTQAY